MTEETKLATVAPSAIVKGFDSTKISQDELDELEMDDFEINGYVMDPRYVLKTLKIFESGNISLVDRIFRSQRIATPGSGAMSFKVPVAGQEKPKVVISLKGVVLWFRPDHALFEGEYGKGEGKKAPVCTSRNGQMADLAFPENRYGRGSTENPTGACGTCQMGRTVWLQNNKNRPPCRWGKVVFFLPTDISPEGSFIPYVLSVAPTATGLFDDWVSGVAFAGRQTGAVEVSVTIETDKQQDGGAEFSKMKFTTLRSLTKEERTSIQNLQSLFVPLLKAAAYGSNTKVVDEVEAIKQQVLQNQANKPVAPTGFGEQVVESESAPAVTAGYVDDDDEIVL